MRRLTFLPLLAVFACVASASGQPGGGEPIEGEAQSAPQSQETAADAPVIKVPAAKKIPARRHRRKNRTKTTRKKAVRQRQAARAPRPKAQAAAVPAGKPADPTVSPVPLTPIEPFNP